MNRLFFVFSLILCALLSVQGQWINIPHTDLEYESSQGIQIDQVDKVDQFNQVNQYLRFIFKPTLDLNLVFLSFIPGERGAPSAGGIMLPNSPLEIDLETCKVVNGVVEMQSLLDPQDIIYEVSRNLQNNLVTKVIEANEGPKEVIPRTETRYWSNRAWHIEPRHLVSIGANKLRPENRDVKIALYIKISEFHFIQAVQYFSTSVDGFAFGRGTTIVKHR